MTSMLPPEPASGAAFGPRPLVHVVDDDDAVRDSLSLLLGGAGHAVREHPSAESLLRTLDAPRPRAEEPGVPCCAVVDLLMPGGMDGLALQEELTRRGAALPVVVVTGHGDVARAVGAMRAGAVNFIEKPYPKAQVLGAVREALARSLSQGGRETEMAAAQRRIAELSPREREVLRSIVEGQPNKRVAFALGITERTVEAHRASLLAKLGVRGLAGAVRLALLAEWAEEGGPA